MKKDSKKDSGVSPVIGTILLVAITVVLVAIISAVVMGMTGNVETTHTVGVKVTADSNDHTVDIVFTGGDYKEITSIDLFGGPIGGAEGSLHTESFTTTPIVLGHKYTVTGLTPGVYSVKVSAKFNDGTESVIWKGDITV